MSEISEQNQAGLLQQVDTPEQLRQLDKAQLEELAEQLREFLIDTLSRTVVTWPPAWEWWN